MQFDWFTFGAQLVNFFLLLLLLRRFLFTPIQRAMRAREEAIAARFQAAAEQMKKAEQEGERWREQHQAFEAKRAEMIATVEAEAATLHKQMVQVARAEVAALQERWYAALEHEQSEFLHALRQRINQQLFVIARRALTDLANADLERQIFALFLQRLQQLAVPERTRLIEAVQESKQAVIIRSTFALPYDERQDLLTLLNEMVGETIDLQFREAPELLCGIELEVYGQRVAWSLHHYLEEMEDHLATLFKSDDATGASVGLPDQIPLVPAKEAQV